MASYELVFKLEDDGDDIVDEGADEAGEEDEQNELIDEDILRLSGVAAEIGQYIELVLLCFCGFELLST